ncbi:MAG TPA: alpha/beta fold hydrolase [Mycobacteriales bacterium]|nr:alpha/beta fold hydrolase [Mycobacteriales bacterium]
MTDPRSCRRTIGVTTWHIRSVGQHGGDVPPVVMVPGLGAGDYLMPHATELAATGRLVVVPDMPGFGHSRAPRRCRTVDEFADALLEFLDGYVGEPVDLIGNSFGTEIVLAAAARSASAARRLVLIGPTFDAAARTLPTVFARWLRIAPKEPPSLAVSLLRSYAQSGVRTPWFALLAGLNDQPEQRIGCVRQPVLLIRGSEDRIAPAAWLDRLAGLAADAQTAEVAGAAHTVDYAAPAVAAALTARFLDG